MPLVYTYSKGNEKIAMRILAPGERDVITKKVGRGLGHVLLNCLPSDAGSIVRHIAYPADDSDVQSASRARLPESKDTDSFVLTDGDEQTFEAQLPDLGLIVCQIIHLTQPEIWLGERPSTDPQDYMYLAQLFQA